MREFHFSPEQLAKFTIPQLMCLCSKNHSGDKKITTPQEWQEYVNEEKRKESEWSK